MKIRNFIAVAAFATAVFVVPSVSQAASGVQDTSKVLRASAILTASDVLTTTMSLPESVKAVHFFVDYTKGSLTSASFAPAGALTGNPAATGYYKTTGAITTVTDTGRYHIRVPRADFGAYRYAGLFCLGTGTATSSAATVTAKYEY